MAKTKDELIAEAEAKGVTLTGKETKAELLEMLGEADDAAAETAAGAGGVDLPEPEPQPEKGKHILVDLTGAGSFSLMDAPAGYNGDAPERTLNIAGRNVEHVSTHPSGVWEYRGM